MFLDVSQGYGVGDGVGAVTPVPGLLAGIPALGIQGAATVAETFPGVPVLALAGGVADPAELVVAPGWVPADAPTVPQGPATVLIVAPELVIDPELPVLGVGWADPPPPDPGLGLACGEVPDGFVPGDVTGELVAPGVVFWLGVVVVL